MQTVNIPKISITSQNPKTVNMPVKSTENKVENVKKHSTEHEMGYDIVEDIKNTKANISFLRCVIYPNKNKIY